MLVMILRLFSAIENASYFDDKFGGGLGRVKSGFQGVGNYRNINGSYAETHF